MIKRQAIIGNMDKLDTHLADEALRLGAELIDVVFRVE